MITPDSSVVIAALAPWHVAHEEAQEALARSTPRLVAHVAYETTSALSRMPEGRRIAPEVVLEALERRFPTDWLALDAAEARAAIHRAVGAGLRGGALYDGLIAATADRHGAQLLTGDRRARRTYEAFQVQASYLAF